MEDPELIILPATTAAGTLIACVAINVKPARFTDVLLFGDHERIRKKTGYDGTIVTPPLYYYNYDREWMSEHIEGVVSLSKEPEAQGLPPLSMCDGFIQSVAKRERVKWRS